MDCTPAANWIRLSTNSAPIPVDVTRGSVDFDAAALRLAIQDLSWERPLESPLLDSYRAFYGLTFSHIPHRHTLFCLPSSAERLAVQHFVPARVNGYVLLCHGYYDHVGLFGHCLDYFLRRGIAVITYDQIGHGLSSGEPVTIDSFDTYVAATAVVYQHAQSMYQVEQPWHWFGQSMGGAITMEFLQQHPTAAEQVGTIILLAPLVRPYAWWFNRWVFAIAKHTITERPRTLTQNAENPEFHALQRIDPLQARVLPVDWVQAMVHWYERFVTYPTSQLAPLLLQGDSDRTVDWKYNLALYEKRYPNSRHLVIPGGRHHLANESADIRKQMWSFIDAQAGFSAEL